MFKPGDKAWHIRLDWGVVEKITGTIGIEELKFKSDNGGFLDYPILTSGKYQESDLNPVIFHKKQKFDLSEPEPEIGTWGWLWDEGVTDSAAWCKLSKIVDGKYLIHTKRHTTTSPPTPPYRNTLKI